MKGLCARAMPQLFLHRGEAGEAGHGRRAPQPVRGADQAQGALVERRRLREARAEPIAVREHLHGSDEAGMAGAHRLLAQLEGALEQRLRVLIAAPRHPEAAEVRRRRRLHDRPRVLDFRDASGPAQERDRLAELARRRAHRGQGDERLGHLGVAFALDPLVQRERTARDASALAHLAAIDQRLGQAVQAGGDVRRRQDRIESGEGHGAAQERFRLRGVPLRRGQRGQDVEREDLACPAIHAPHARVVDREAAPQQRLGLHQTAVADEEEAELAHRRRQAFVDRAVRAFEDIHRLAKRRLRARAVAGGDLDGGQQSQGLRLAGRAARGGGQSARDDRLREGEVVGRARDVQDPDRGRRFLGGGVGGPRGLECRT
jgi:hypothetical protein